MVYHKDDFEEANESAAARLSKTPTATAAYYDPHTACVVIELSSGIALLLRPQEVQGLSSANPEQLTRAEISPSGFGIYFPDIDVDIYLPSLLEGYSGSRQWMAAQLGKMGGSVKSDAKAVSSRENGKRGGRPRKVRANTVPL